jgi:hypothetical protein
MTRTMYDSTTAGDCPSDGDLYAGYVDGVFADFGDMVRLHPGKRYVRISVSAFGGPADMLDVENEDATPEQAPGWVNRMRASDVLLPAIYCNRGNEDEVAAALEGAHIPTTAVVLVVATLDGTETGPVTVRGYRVVACQNRGPAQTGGHYDASVVYADDWMPTTAAPLPQFQPQTVGDLDMATVKQQAITIGINQNGEGFADVAVPFANVISLIHNGTDPQVDGFIRPGEVHAQMREDADDPANTPGIMITLSRCIPAGQEHGGSEVVWLEWLE